MLFTGQHEHTIDAKQRLSIPSAIRARWNAQLHGEAWYAVPWVGGVVRLYTEVGFESRAKEYSLSLTPDPDEAELLATLFGMSERLTPDAAGRIRLPEETLLLAGLETEVALIGAGDWLEIRDRTAWRESKKARLEQLPQLLAKIEAKRRERPQSD